jgi:hypothetical protein
LLDVKLGKSIKGYVFLKGIIKEGLAVISMGESLMIMVISASPQPWVIKKSQSTNETKYPVGFDGC